MTHKNDAKGSLNARLKQSTFLYQTTDLFYTVSVKIRCMLVSRHRVGVDDPLPPVASRLVTMFFLVLIWLINMHTLVTQPPGLAVVRILHKFTRQNVCIRNCIFGQQSLNIELFDLSCFSVRLCAHAQSIVVSCDAQTRLNCPSAS